MPKIDIEGKEHSVPLAVYELVQSMMIELNHFEIVNKKLLGKLNFHTIVFAETGWSIQHPPECELDKCEIHKAAQERFVHPPEELGVYKIWLEEGELKVVSL